MALQSRMISKLPAGIRIHPIEGVFATLGLITATLAIVGGVSSAVLARFPWWGVVLWTSSLFIGCGAWLLGLLSTSVEKFDTVAIRKVPIYTFGLTLVSGSALVYGIAIVILVGWDAGLSALTWFMLSIGTYVRRTYLVSSVKGE